MAEYITKKAAINAVENAPIELFQSEWNEIGEMINAVPAADVAPVVHCKDCKHAIGRWSDLVCCVYNYPLMRPDDFCSYGERRDGGADNETD